MRSFSLDRKSTRLNSSHYNISYAVFCLKKKIVIFACMVQVHLGRGVGGPAIVFSTPAVFFFLMIRLPPRSPLFPYTPLFRSRHGPRMADALAAAEREFPSHAGGDAAA